MKLIMDDGREITLSQEVQEMLEKEISQQEKNRNFSEVGDKEHWYIDAYGKIQKGNIVGLEDVENLCTFTNEEFTSKIKFKEYMERKLLKFKEEYDNADLDWDDDEVEKITFRWSHSKNKIEAISFYATKIQGTIYFSTKEIAEKCIEMYEDDLIKYFQLGIW